MPKTTKAHFELFKKECLYWQERLGLQRWELIVAHEELGSLLSQLRYNCSSYRATAVLNITWDGVDKSERLNNNTIITSAIHEIVHLLKAEMSSLGRERYVGEDELFRAEEAVVNILVREFMKLRKGN